MTNIKGDATEIYDTIDGGSLVFMTNSVVIDTFPVSIANNIWSNVLNTTLLPNDIYDVYVYITNNAKLVTVVTQMNVEVTNDTGLFVHISPTNNEYITGTSTTITGYIDTGSFGVSNAYFKTNGGTWAYLNTAGNTNWWTNINTTDYPDGNNAFWFMFIDDNNVTNHFHSNVYVIDNSVPLLGITNLSIGQVINGTFTFKGTNSDPHSGIYSTILYITNTGGAVYSVICDTTASNWTNAWNTASTNDGEYFAYIVSSNNAGLYTNTPSIQFFINNNMPAGTFTNPQPYIWITNTNVIFAGWGSNLDVSIGAVYFSTNGIDWGETTLTPDAGSGKTNWSTNVNVFPLADSSNVFYMIASNIYGAVVTNTHTNRFDFTPPDTTFDQALSNNTLSGATNIHGTATENFDTIDGGALVFMTNGIPEYTFPVTVTGSVWTNPIITAGILNNTYDVLLYMTNNAKLVSVITQTNVTVSNDAGIFVHVSPTNDEYIYGTTTTITGYIYTGSFGVSNAYFMTNDGTWAKLNLAADTTNWWTNIDTTDYPDGSNAFHFMFIDVNEDTNDIHSNWYIVDNSVPSLGITNVTGGEYISGAFTFRGTNIDPHSGILGTRVYITNASTMITNAASLITGGFTNEWQSTNVSDGRYYVFAETTNNAGLYTNTASIMFIVNNEDPAITETNTGQFVTNAGSVLFAGIASNVFSGIDPMKELLMRTNAGTSFYPVSLSGTSWYTNIDTKAGIYGDGTNTFIFFAVNSNDRTNSITVTNIVDNSLPFGAVTNNVNSAVIAGSSVNISGTNAENWSTITANVLVTNGAVYGSTAVSPWSFDFDSTKAGNGLLELELIVSNSVGLVFTNTWTNYVSNVAPGITFVSPTNAPAPLWMTNTTLITGYITSTFGAITNVEFRTNGDAVWHALNTGPTNLLITNVLSVSWFTNFNPAPSENKTNIILIRTHNEYGIAVTNTLTTRVDFTAPVLSITNPLALSNIAGTVKYMGSNYDSFAPVTGFRYSVTNGPWIADTVALNWTNSINTTLYPDGEFVFAVMSSNDAGFVTYAYITNYISNTGITAAFTNPQPFTWLTNDTVTYAGWASNVMGSITGVLFSVNGTVWGRAATNSAASGADWYTNVQISSISEGTNIFYVMASNEYGAVYTNMTTNYFDFTAPALAITNPVNNEVIGGTVTFAGTNIDTACLITRFEYRTNAGAWTPAPDTNNAWSIPINTLTYPDGQLIFTVLSSNEAGFVITDSITVYISNELLYAYITNPQADTYITSSNALFSGYAEELSGQEITGLWFGTNANALGGVNTAVGGVGITNWWTNVDVSSLADSTNVFVIVASNEAGFMATNYQTNYIDFTPPVLAITNPTNNAEIAGYATFAGTNYDSFSPVTAVWYSINDGSWIQTNQINANWQIQINTGNYPVGQFKFDFISSNSAGLISSQYVTNIISNASILCTVPSGNYIRTNLTLSGIYDGGANGISDLYMMIDGVTGWGTLTTNSLTTWSTNFTATSLASEDTYIFSFMYLDTSGYSNYTYTRNIIVDYTPPAMVSPITNMTNYEAFNVTLSASDYSGIKNIYYTLDGSAPTTSSASVANGGSVPITETTTIRCMAEDNAGNMSSVSSAEITIIPNEAFERFYIDEIKPMPYTPEQGLLEIHVKKSELLPNIKLYITDIHGLLINEITDPTPDMFLSIFTYDGVSKQGEAMSRGIYIVLPVINGRMNKRLARKIYIDY
ncbi:beta strand repeat-containing protein [Spirochaetota bacterium]